MANPLEGPPGGSREMVWARCPQCSGKGTVKDWPATARPAPVAMARVRSKPANRFARLTRRPTLSVAAIASS